MSLLIRARLAAHDAEELFPRLGVVGGRPEQRVDEADQRGQRRAQFVAGIGDEIGAQRIEPLLVGEARSVTTR